MTRTELDRIRQRQRHYEWELGRDTQIAAAAQLVAGKTHDLLNLVQIVQLATGELARRGDAESQEFIADLERAGIDAQHRLGELMAVARPPRTIVPGAAVGAAITAAVALVRPFVAIDVHLGVEPATVTRCRAEDLEHLILGLALDVLDEVPRIELAVRERTIEGKPWVELVRGALTTSGDAFELRVVEAIALRAGGELARSEGRTGTEVIVALPVVRT
jgi:hypothetical protein